MKGIPNRQKKNVRAQEGKEKHLMRLKTLKKTLGGKFKTRKKSRRKSNA